MNFTHYKAFVLTLLCTLTVIVASGCTSNEKTSNQVKPTDELEVSSKQQQKLDDRGITINNGILYVRRFNKNELIEMMVDTEDPNLDLEVALSPTQQGLEDTLPSYESSALSEFASDYFVNAQGYFLNREYQRALIEINRAIKENPNSSIAWALKGSIHYRRKENGLARIAWQKSLKINPDAERVKEMLNFLGK